MSNVYQIWCRSVDSDWVLHRTMTKSDMTTLTGLRIMRDSIEQYFPPYTCDFYNCRELNVCRHKSKCKGRIEWDVPPVCHVHGCAEVYAAKLRRENPQLLWKLVEV